MRPHSARRRLAASPALIAALTCGVLGGGLVGAGALGFDQVDASAAAVLDAKITRPEVIARAVSWVEQRVPYSQSQWWTDSNGTYRQDCSGMVSMAWRLSQQTNYWTGNLTDVSYRIPSSSLRRGDILLRPRQHTLIFAGWADEAHTTFNLYEQYRSGHPARYVLDASLSHYLDRGFGAYRYTGITDALLDLPPVLTHPTTTTRAERGTASVQLTPATAARASITAVLWTPEAALAVEPQSAAPAAARGVTTPEAVADLSVADLVAAQRSVDAAVLEVGRRAVDAGTSGDDLIAAGVILLLLAFPFGTAVRAGAWSPAAGVSRHDATRSKF